MALAALAGCTEPTGPGPKEEPPDAGPGAGVQTRSLEFQSIAGVGTVLVDSAGRTLYVFTDDEAGLSTCLGSCLVNWPPVLASQAPPAPPVVAGDLDVIQRADGTMQLAYKGLPLYYYSGDTSPGDAKGDGRGGVWFVVRHPPSNSEMLNDAGTFTVLQENLAYHGDVVGNYARPAEGTAKTGVVMIHEWWGLTDNIRDMAHLLATHGYAVMAVDLFEGSVATTPADALAQVRALNQDEANANMQVAADYLRAAGAEDIISLGWCFGGGQSLQLALSGEMLAGTVIYYGSLVTDEARLAAIDWPVLGIFGEDDDLIPPTAVRQFEAALNNVSIQNTMFIYPDVGHAFANPSGDAWAPDQTADAWVRTLAFLKANAA